MKAKKTYDNQSIRQLKGADRVRKRPGVIFGSDGLEGCEHAYFEILSNAIDEAKDGYGDKIETILHPDGSISIKDYGRGIPLDYNETEQCYNWYLVFCELYAGGKYDSDGENYEYSLGLNGLGACATQYASSFFHVSVVRDGFEYQLDFQKGENVGGLKKTPTKKTQTGTIQTWKPDDDVFTDTDIPLSYFLDINQKQAMINQKVRFIVIDEKEEKSYEYYYENGIMDYLSEYAQGKMQTTPALMTGEGIGKDKEDKPEYKVKAEIAFAFNSHYPCMEFYHNSSWLEHGGSPEKAVKLAFVYAFDKYMKQKGKYHKNESKITFQDIADSLMIIINSFSTMTSYENQTKKAINNKFIQDFLSDLMKSKLEVWMIENQMDANKAADQILVNKRSREASEKQRIALNKKFSSSTDSWDRIEKFVDCKSQDVSRRELFIVEGDSALGSVKLGRNAEFQGIMPVRGKILNCLKADYARIFKSDVITDLIRVLGCGVEIPVKGAKKGVLSFDLNNLKWNKIIICTDADVDGFQIRTLVMTMLYRLCPSLIQQGYVYIALTPLYEIQYKQNTYFAYDETEKAKIIKGKDASKLFIQRSKGLGENEPEMMWQTTMNPETRRLVRILPEEAEKMAEYFELFLGNNIETRKQYIQEYGHLYMDNLDIS